MTSERRIIVKYREKLGYIALGGILMLVGMLAARVVSPLGAQTEVRDAVFESVTCRRIWVIDEDAKLVVGISGGLGGGEITSRGIAVHGKKGQGGAVMTVDEHGGVINVHGEDGSAGVEMRTSEYGGHVGVLGKRDTNPRVAINVNEFGHGAVGTWDKNGYRLATLRGEP